MQDHSGIYDLKTELWNQNDATRYFDIPFQSGDDKIIKAMNRIGSAQNYISLVEGIKSVFPEAVLRTTFLTGFPGEDDCAANNTKEFLMNIQRIIIFSNSDIIDL